MQEQASLSNSLRVQLSEQRADSALGFQRLRQLWECPRSLSHFHSSFSEAAWLPAILSCMPKMLSISCSPFLLFYFSAGWRGGRFSLRWFSQFQRGWSQSGVLVLGIQTDQYLFSFLGRADLFMSLPTDRRVGGGVGSLLLTSLNLPYSLTLPSYLNLPSYLTFPSSLTLLSSVSLVPLCSRSYCGLLGSMEALLLQILASYCFFLSFLFLSWSYLANSSTLLASSCSLALTTISSFSRILFFVSTICIQPVISETTFSQQISSDWLLSFSCRISLSLRLSSPLSDSTSCLLWIS